MIDYFRLPVLFSFNDMNTTSWHNLVDIETALLVCMPRHFFFKKSGMTMGHSEPTVTRVGPTQPTVTRIRGGGTSPRDKGAGVLCRTHFVGVCSA
jgi:hypothetical protein